MTVTAFHVIPFISVFNTKCMNTVFFSKIVWLVFGPSCEVPSSAIRPNKETFRGDVI